MLPQVVVSGDTSTTQATVVYGEGKEAVRDVTLGFSSADSHTSRGLGKRK